MKKFTMFAALALVMVFALSSFAGEEPQRQMGFSNFEGSANLSKAQVDTILLMGPEDSGAPYWGDFTSGWNGWTSEDITKPTETHWNISNYNQAVATNLAAWCGDIGIVSCDDSTDPVGGYGNDWNDILAWRATVANPGISAQVTVTADLIHDTEPDYDYTRVGFWKKGSNSPSINVSYDDVGVKSVNETTTYLPGEYFADTDILVVFNVTSDGGWSDEDCSWPTAGACQVDNIDVLVTQAGEADITGFEDFQSNPVLFVDLGVVDPPQQEWYITFPFGVGDYAQLWSDLEEIDPCADNFTQQVAFIDDGIVVPGTGGSDCINWCYGPSGYIVNTLGGLVGPEAHIQNYVNSPVMTWPAGNYDGIIFEYGVYGHEDSSFDSPGIYTSWGVRSADTAGGQVIEDQGWRDRNFVYFGAASYTRNINEVVNLMEPNRDRVQVRVGVYELGWVFGGGTGALIGNDGYPAPYFDNVAVKIFDYSGGPSMTSREIDLANDNFLEVDAINTGALGTMHVRFDMARNISPRGDLRNDPGDSIVVDVLPARSGATLVGMPEIRYTIDANPVFNSFRTAPTTGSFPGRITFNAQGFVVADRYNFDLPDSGTLWPGDVLHYHIYAEEDLGGTVYPGTYPADITGYGDFSDPMAYNTAFTIRALPTIADDGQGGYVIPQTLWWNDFSRRGGEQEWFNAFRNIGLVQGLDYDVYRTGGPTSSVGSGLGGRTTGLALSGYENLLYSAGTTFSTTLSNGDFGTDGGNDIGALLEWLSAGGKDMFLTGDGIATDMAINVTDVGSQWLGDIMGLDFTTSDIRTFIGNQATPLVLTTPQGASNPVFPNISTWMAYGGCGGINSFDGVTPKAGATRLAEFADPNGDPGAYSFAAATLNEFGAGNRCVSMPYDFMFVYTPIGAKADAPLASRSVLMTDVLSFFGIEGDPLQVSDVPDGRAFKVGRAYPNPFNPITKIAYTLPKAGHMTMKVFNVRGQLVKTLVDGTVAAEGIVEWNGTNNQGASVPSGVYFYETRSGNNVEVNKMALVK